MNNLVKSAPGYRAKASSSSSSSASSSPTTTTTTSFTHHINTSKSKRMTLHTVKSPGTHRASIIRRTPSPPSTSPSSGKTHRASIIQRTPSPPSSSPSSRKSFFTLMRRLSRRLAFSSIRSVKRTKDNVEMIHQKRRDLDIRAQKNAVLLREHSSSNMFHHLHDVQAQSEKDDDDDREIMEFLCQEHTYMSSRARFRAIGGSVRDLTIQDLQKDAQKLRMNTTQKCVGGRRASHSESETKAQTRMIPLSDLPTNESPLSGEMTQVFQSSALRMLRENSSSWGFDTFAFANLCNGNPLATALTHFMNKFSLTQQFNVPNRTLLNFATTIEMLYTQDIHYHTNVHATDVLCNIAFFLQSSLLHSVLTPLEQFAALIAAVIHDVGHPGVNNNFMIETESTLALTYNDQHVLENYHCSLGFRALKRQQNNILSSLDRHMQKEFRSIVVHMVLGTDMQMHSKHVTNLINVIGRKQNSKESFCTELKADRQLLLEVTLHVADIANPAKPRHLAIEWAYRLRDEFFAQGDREQHLGLPVSLHMNRNEPDQLPQSQMNFITLVVKPLVKPWATVVPEASISLWYLGANYAYWKTELSKHEASTLSMQNTQRTTSNPKPQIDKTV